MNLPARIWTVGHSNRTLEAFLELGRAHALGCIVDVRRVPASRRLPHFTRASLERALTDAGMEYLWLPGLGGMREPQAGSPHTAWSEPAFAGYADHMASAEWCAEMDRLLARAAAAPTAILCAEARYLECHRQLIADALQVRGVEVLHLVDAATVQPHRLTSFARVEETRLIYDRGQVELGFNSVPANRSRP